MAAPKLHVPAVSEATRKEILRNWGQTRDVMVVAETVGLDMDTCRRVILAQEACAKGYFPSGEAEARVGRVYGGGRKGQYLGAEHDNYGDEGSP